MYLDQLQPLEATVGYGSVGVSGSLGYEGKTVSVRGKDYTHALSTHPPARLRFAIKQGYQSFHTLVALNDDVPNGRSQADFLVYTDGRLVASEAGVRVGESPRLLVADLRGATHLELEVRTSRWEFCHAVWLEPRFDAMAAPPSELEDALRRVKVHLHPRPKAQRCIATASSVGFAGWLDNLLGSLNANGGCSDALQVVFVLGQDPQSETIAARYGAQVVRCTPLHRLNPSSKGVLYSVARVVDAEYFLCLDADMLVLGDLEPIFAALRVLPSHSILAVREGNHAGHDHLGNALGMYWGKPEDQTRLGMSAEEIAYPLVVNAGLFAGKREGLLELDATLRSIPQGLSWLDEHPRVGWRDQFLFNLALARMKAGVELEGSYNVQLHGQEVQLYQQGARLEASWKGELAQVLHFTGSAKHKYRAWQKHYAGIAQPLVGSGSDAYAEFLKALRCWLGRYGLGELAWSFYGTTDGQSARVADPSCFPLLGLLHYLIRSNGCVKVLETGTARGISAACLASAVSHRQGGKVVTLDPYAHEGREALWAVLPQAMRSCIEARAVDGLAGMRAALEAEECYQAVLLDSIHSEEHVWAEFELARQLVVEGGLILIHDIHYLGGTVGAAVRRIEQAGYAVTGLWGAKGGIHEDDCLGLAVIENRRRE